MSTVKLEPEGAIAVLKMANGVTNAIGSALVGDLADALAEVRSRYRGCVLAGGEKFFCIGLDLPALLALDREAMSRFWDAFDRLILDLYGLPLPTAAAIEGHATAGGTILALTADYRYISRGRRLMGLNEVNIGVPVPYLADLMLRQLVDDRAATEMLYRGELMEPAAARRIGLVDGICNAGEAVDCAIQAIEPLAEKSPQAFGIIKENRIGGVRREFAENRESQKQQMLDCWFRPEVRNMLERAAAKF